jgi:HAD superfamily hydrolase (TIGR01509 family)
MVFDMDGVIVNSHPAHRSAWHEFLRSVGKDVADADLDFIMDGRKRTDILLHFLGPLTSSDLQRYGKLKDELFWRAASQVQPIPGAFDFIEDVSRAGIPMAVATSASASRTRSTLRRVGVLDHFQAVVTGDDVPEGKPNPAIYRLACARVKSAPAATVAIEDAVAGVQAAKAAGLKCVAISTSQSPQKLSDAGADCVFQDFANLSIQQLLLRLGIIPAC